MATFKLTKCTGHASIDGRFYFLSRGLRFRKVLRSPGDADFLGFSLCGIRKFADSLCIPFMMFDKAEMLCRRKRN